MRHLIILLLFCSVCIVTLPEVTVADNTVEPPLTLLKKPQQNIPGAQTQFPNIQPGIQPGQPELHDIHGPVVLKEKSKAFLYGGIAAILLIIAVILYLFMKRRKKQNAPVIPPWDTALAELHAAKSLLNPDQALLYMNQVSGILRKYIESRFNIRSTRQTTSEFLCSLKNSTTDPSILNSRTELQTCLSQCDMAKFAHQIPVQQNMESMESAIFQFVEKTRPELETSGGKS